MEDDKTIEQEKEILKPLNSIIQICPVCSKVDVYKDDGHCCVTYINKQSL